MKSSKPNVFEKWFLGNRFSIGLINVVLFLIALWCFNQVSFFLNPFWVFLNAILPPIILAGLQFYLMLPIVDFCQKRLKVPRTVTILVLFVIVLLVLVWVINTLIPIVQTQVDSLLKNWPAIWRDTSNAIQKTLSDPRLGAVKGSLQDQLDKLQGSLFKSGQDMITAALGNINSAVSIITMIGMTLITAPFILFFMLKDGRKFRPYLTKFVPQHWQASFSEMLHDMSEAISSYVRGQIIVAVCVGIMFALGYSLIGLPYGVALAVIAGFMNLIPYFGTFIALIPALAVGMITSVPLLMKVIIVFMIEQTVESRLISPFVVGNKMSMHPVTTMLLLIGASAVWGLWGVFFGIPIYAIVKIVTYRAYRYYRLVSGVFDDELEPTPPAAETNKTEQK